MRNAPLILALLLAFLVGGGVFLWLKPPPATPTAATQAVPAAPGDAAPPAQFLILAASWEPAFCETAPGKPECRSLDARRHDASHFALHGLWPTDSYCNVSKEVEEDDRGGRWSQLPAVELTDATRAALDTAMPGTQSQLERHEWIKHGTCFGTNAEGYYATSIRLLAALNASPVRDLFADNLGRELTSDTIRATFDAAFGKGAGSRVRVACEDDGQRRIITELTIGMYGTTADATLGNLILTANPTSAGCQRGIVDPVGLQ